MTRSPIRPSARHVPSAPVTTRRWSHRLAAIGLAVLLGVAPRAAQAQGGTISGSVVDQGSQRPLPNVQVSVQGQAGRGAVSDANGRFRISGVSGTTVTLDARLIGYSPVQRTVQVGATNVQFMLSQRAIELNQVVVTGTAGATQRRELGTAVAQVNVADVTAKTAVPSVDALPTMPVPG